MQDRLGIVIGLEILRGRVRAVRRAVHEDVVPGLIPFGLGRVGLVPRLIGAAPLIDRDDDAAVRVASMSNDHAGGEVTGGGEERIDVAMRVGIAVGAGEADHRLFQPAAGGKVVDGSVPVAVVTAMMTAVMPAATPMAVARARTVPIAVPVAVPGSVAVPAVRD